MKLSYWESEYFIGKPDIVVVGMGLTGLQTAIELKWRAEKAEILVIDNSPWSQGASTKNAGFACFANVSEILDDFQHHSKDQVYQLANERFQGIQKLRKNYGDNMIGYEAKGSVEVFNQKTRPDLEAALDHLQEINTSMHEYLGLDQVFQYRSNSDFPNSLGAISNPYEGQLNTGKLYHSVLQLAHLMGIKIVGGLALRSWEETGKIIKLELEDMELSCSNLVLCTNAFTKQFVDIDIVPARGQVLVTEVLESLPCEGLHHYSRGYYYWRDIDGRILLGGARNLDKLTEQTSQFEANSTIVDELKRFLYEEILQNEVAIEHQWSGIMGMGKHAQKEAIVKTVSTNVVVAARLGGMGVALSSVIAERAAKLLLD